MKYLSLIALLLGIGIQPVFAEKGGPWNHPDKRARHMEKMIDELQLSDEQEPRVRQILEEQHGKMQARMLRLREQLKPEMEAIAAETSERLADVLNEEQMKTFDSHVQKKREKMQKRHDRWQGQETGE